MAKKTPVTIEELPEVFDFSDMPYDHDHDHDDMMGFMSGMLEASNNQMLIALELTKLIVTNNPADSTEDRILAIFKNATNAVSDNTALKKLMEQMEQ